MINEHVENKKKIVIFTRSLSSGGAEKQSILLAKGLKEKYNVVIISSVVEMQLARNIEFLNSEKITYYQLTGSMSDKIIQFYKILKNIQPFAIINFLPGNNILGGFFGRLIGVKRIIGSIRTTKIDTLAKFIQLLLSHLFFNHFTVFNSKAGYDYNYKKGFQGKKSVVIQNCLFPLPLPIKREGTDLVILIVARFEDYKDYPTALEAFKLTREKYPEKNIKLKIVGQGTNEKQVLKWIIDNNLQEHISVTINPDNVNEHYIKSTIFLQTSLQEGFSNSIMEAMSHSLPLVVTDVGDNNQMVVNAENGYLVPVKQPNIIANRLGLLIDSENLREQMGKRSYEIIKDNFSLEKFANEFSRVIEK